jgi:hypothetical protein
MLAQGSFCTAFGGSDLGKWMILRVLLLGMTFALIPCGIFSEITVWTFGLIFFLLYSRWLS